MARKPTGIKHLRQLLISRTYIQLAHELGYKQPSSIVRAMKVKRVGMSLALRIHRKFDVSLDELGH